MLLLERRGLIVAALLLASIGCTKAKDEPSYADLVVTYNAELAALDRLEEKRDALIAAYEEEHRPKTEDAVKSISDLVLATGRNSRAKGAVPADPNKALDQAVSDAEKAQDVTASILQTLGEARDQPVEYSEEFKQQLAGMDAEIESQKKRVERARQARDAAEQSEAP